MGLSPAPLEGDEQRRALSQKRGAASPEGPPCSPRQDGGLISGEALHWGSRVKCDRKLSSVNHNTFSEIGIKKAHHFRSALKEEVLFKKDGKSIQPASGCRERDKGETERRERKKINKRKVGQ